MNKLLLRLIGRLGPLWRRLGIDGPQLVAILEVKLLMDSRRKTMFRQQQSKDKETSNQDIINMVFYFFMGLMMVGILYVAKQPALGFTLYFTVWMVMLALTLIGDFTDVLFDLRDNYVILPTPVSDRTVIVARLLHVLLYLFKLAVAFMLPGLVFVMIVHGWWTFPVFLLLSFLSLIMIIFGVNMIYLLLLRLTSPARFKEWINYFQIIFTVLILAGYYLLPNLIDFKALGQIDWLRHPAAYWLPPAWLGRLWHLLVLGDTSVPILIQGSLALLAPAFFLWLITRVLAGTFSQRLQALTEGRNDTPNLTGTDTVRAELGPWPRFWQGLLCASPPEAAAFALSWKMTARSRDYKLRVYPSLAFLPMMFFYFGVAQGEGSLAERWQEVQMGYHYLLLGYFSLFLVITPLTSTYFSDQYAAAWVFPASPVARPGELLAVTFSAILVRFMLPGFLLLLLSAGLIWWGHALDDVLLAGLLCVAM
ncbi:MAG: hypothetical protein KDC54_04520, partial [Lewinella sp.]|nr:hypothetical protein [Lewinella sp.]